MPRRALVLPAAALLAMTPAPRADTALELARPSPVDQYLDAIERSYDLGGAWAPELGDLYLGLGRALLERGRPEEALDALQEAVQNVRVNRGLDSPEQTEHLFTIADIQDGLGRPDEADEVIETAWRLAADAYAGGDMAALETLERSLRWFVGRRQPLSPRARYADMEHYGELTERLATLSEEGLGLSHPLTEKHYRALGQVHFHTTRYVLGRGMSVEPGLVLATGGRQTTTNDTVSVNEHYQAGKKAFAKAAESAMLRGDATPLERAEALALLGDWYLAFDHYGSAGKQYREAWDLLAEAPELRPEDHLGRPTPIRVMDGAVFAPEDEAPAAETVTVSLNISRSGRVRQVEFLATPEGLDEERRKDLRDRIERIRFRPALVAGEPEHVQGFVWDYEVPPTDA